MNICTYVEYAFAKRAYAISHKGLQIFLDISQPSWKNFRYDDYRRHRESLSTTDVHTETMRMKGYKFGIASRSFPERVLQPQMCCTAQR